MIWNILFIVILTIGAAVLYQWGVDIWKGRPIAESTSHWLAIFLWLSAADFIVDVLKTMLMMSGFVPTP